MQISETIIHLGLWQVSLDNILLDLHISSHYAKAEVINYRF